MVINVAKFPSVPEQVHVQLSPSELKDLVRDMELVLRCVSDDPFNTILIQPIEARDRLKQMVQELKKALP